MKEVDKKELKELIEEAKIGMKNAFVPRSNFSVGAAILTCKGNVYHGCNVESVISGLGTCAERCVIDNAASNGEYCFRAILIISKNKNPIKPCGACLQYIAEFSEVSGHDIEIIMVDSRRKIKRSSIRKMLPKTIGPVDEGLNIKKYRCAYGKK